MYVYTDINTHLSLYIYIYIQTHIYIYIYIHTYTYVQTNEADGKTCASLGFPEFAKTVTHGVRKGRNPHRAQISQIELFEFKFLDSSCSRSKFSIRAFRAHMFQFELFELVLLLKLDNKLHVERFEAAASLSAVPSPPLNLCSVPARSLPAYVKTSRFAVRSRPSVVEDPGRVSVACCSLACGRN